MNRFVLSLFVLFCLSTTSWSQSPFFTKTYGDYYLNEGADILEIEPGKYFILANSSVFNNTLNTAVFILGDTGQIVNKAIFPSDFIYKANKSVKTPDAFFICGITNNTSTNDYDGFLTKIDSSLNLLWTKNIGQPDFWNEANTITIIDSTVFVAYNTFGEDNSTVNSKIASFNFNGDSLQTYTPFETGETEIKAMIPYGDSLIAFTGTHKGLIDSISNCIVGTLNIYTGEFITNQFGHILGESCGNGLTKTEIGLTICGTTEKFMTTTKKDGFLLLVNSDLSYHFDMIITDNNYANDDEFFDIVQDSEKNLMVTGYTKSFGLGSEDILLYKFNEGGWYLWSHTFGSQRYDVGNKLIWCSDSGFAALGTTELNGLNNRDVVVIRTNKNLEIEDHFSHIINVPNFNNEVSFSYTNPIEDICWIKFDKIQDIRHISITSLDGKSQLLTTPISSQSDFQINMSDFSKGLYVIKIQTSTNLLVLKVVKV